MSIERNIDAPEHAVFQHERKDLIIPVGDTVDAEGNVTGHVDLTDFGDIEWTLRRNRDAPALVRCTVGEATIAIEDAEAASGENDAARVVLQPEDLAIPAGVYFHSLRELDGNNLLVHGRFVLLGARDPGASPP